MKSIFSGEPLPLAPRVSDAEIENFHRKLLDYLRRLGAKLATLENPTGGSGAVDVFATRLSGNKVLTGTYTALEWDIDSRKDAAYGHSPGSAVVSFLLPGFYFIKVDLDLANTATFPAFSYIELSLGGGNVIIPFSYGDISAAGILSKAVGVPLIAGTSIKVYVKDSAVSSGAAILARGTRLTILRVSQDSTGGTSTTPGTGWEGTGTSLPNTW